jgi:hypothetical protein
VLALIGIGAAVFIFIRRRRQHHNQMIRYTSLAVEEEYHR